MTKPQDLKAELEKTASLLTTLRDELRVRMHLGGLDAKRKWSELESRIEGALERTAKDASEASCAAAKEVVAALNDLLASLPPNKRPRAGQ